VGRKGAACATTAGRGLCLRLACQRGRSAGQLTDQLCSEPLLLPSESDRCSAPVHDGYPMLTNHAVCNSPSKTNAAHAVHNPKQSKSAFATVRQNRMSTIWYTKANARAGEDYQNCDS